jgi:diguanylate cyclase (GGDEF)-like protein
MTPFILALIVGLVAGWYAHVRFSSAAGRPGLATRPVAGPELLPEPALRWLLRAHGALGVWLSERAVGDDDPVIERVIDADRLTVSEVVSLDRRVESARDAERSGVERVEAGTLVIRSRNRFAVALLVPTGATPSPEIDEDLDRLLEGLKRRPEVVALAQARPDTGAIESVGSVALRLAYQLERTTNAAVVVASREPDGVRVAGVSGHADRRLLEKIVARECDLDKVARGEMERMVVRGDPLGGAAGDRRQRPAMVQLEPIMAAGNQVVGAVALWLTGGVEPTGTRLAEILESIREAGPRLEAAQEHAVAERGAYRDPLTGLGNRAELQRAMHDAKLAGGALISIDLDHFKKLNDGLGHPAGDSALIYLAALLRDQVRGVDTVARVGGEEFVIWLPNAPLDVGRRIAERVRAALAARAWDWQGTSRHLTASFGVAASPETSRSIDNLLLQADQALYQAKEQGRDRVVMADRVDGQRSTVDRRP